MRERMDDWRKDYTGFEKLSLAVMGCIVNGPGKLKHADIGISLPGTGELPTAPVYIDGGNRHAARRNIRGSSRTSSRITSRPAGAENYFFRETMKRAAARSVSAALP